MTRINLIDPSQLTDQHLFAEFREIKMVPAALRRSLKTQPIKTVLKKIPKQFTLNSGHVLYFYNKLNYLSKRYDSLVEELKNRGYRDGMEWPLFDDYLVELPSDFFGDYVPTERDYTIINERITEKLNQKPDWYKYYGVSIVYIPMFKTVLKIS
jgi:deoxyribonuclease (pyrimidine dimer)